MLLFGYQCNVHRVSVEGAPDHGFCALINGYCCQRGKPGQNGPVQVFTGAHKAKRRKTRKVFQIVGGIEFAVDKRKGDDSAFPIESLEEAAAQITVIKGQIRQAAQAHDMPQLIDAAIRELNLGQLSESFDAVEIGDIGADKTHPPKLQAVSEVTQFADQTAAGADFPHERQPG